MNEKKLDESVQNCVKSFYVGEKYCRQMPRIRSVCIEWQLRCSVVLSQSRVVFVLKLLANMLQLFVIIVILSSTANKQFYYRVIRCSLFCLQNLFTSIQRKLVCFVSFLSALTILYRQTCVHITIHCTSRIHNI